MDIKLGNIAEFGCEYSAVFKRTRRKIRFGCRDKSFFIWQCVDTVIGCLLVALFFGGFSVSRVDYEVNFIMEQLETFIFYLRSVIQWLMGNPAGLKLNKPLNLTVGHFFLYHIYLWKTFVAFLQPMFGSLLYVIRWSCILGFTMQMSILADLLALLAIHIFCFHIYAASGSGKTTFLNTLVQRNVRHLRGDGHVYVNGYEIGRGITSVSAYVQQDDLFVGTLTVREHLIFQALLRLPKHVSRENKFRRVDEVISDLGLRKCQHTKIGLSGILRGISGGEAKRLAFASEVLTNPSLLFCDEPTTGLDSYMAESVITVLRKLAVRGKTILCIIHQPASEIYTMFDRVIFLAEGRTAFFGSKSETLNFFNSIGYKCPSNFNPADFYIHTLAVVPGEEEECHERIQKVCDKFTASEQNLEVLNMVRATQEPNLDSSLMDFSHKSPYKASRFTQFFVLLWRCVIDNYRNPAVAVVKLVQKAIMGLFVGLLYFDTVVNQQGIMNLNGALFYLVNQFVYPSLFGIINLLPSEFSLSCREHHNGMYTVAAYYISKAISYIPVFTLDGILMVVLAYFLVGFQNNATSFFLTILIAILLEQTSVACGMMFSAISPSFPVAISIAAPFLQLLQLSGGLFANVGQFPAYLSWIQYISWFRYGFEALSITQWRGVNNITCERPGYCVSTGIEVLENLSFSYQYLWRDIGLLVVLLFSFHFIGYIGLSIRTYRAR